MGLLPPVVSILEGDITGFQSKMGVAKTEMDSMATKGESMGSRVKAGMGMGLMAGGAAASAMGAVLLEQSDKIERSEATLKTVISDAGKNFDDYKDRIAAVASEQAKFGHGTSDVEEALAKLTVGLKDPQKALDEMGVITDIAAFKHISLTEAANLDVKMHAGAGRTFKEFGINVKDMTTELKAAETAHKNEETATKANATATDNLANLKERLAGKTHLTISEEQQLEKAQQAVTDSAAKLVKAHQTTIDAEAAAANATKDYDKIIHDQLEPHIKDVAKAQSETFGGRLTEAKTRVEDFAGSIGKTLGPALTAAGPAMMAVGAIIQSNIIPGMIRVTAATISWTAGKVADITVNLAWRASGLLAAAATNVWTAAQWALNVAMDANPIGLIVIGIVALISWIVILVTHWDEFRDAMGHVGSKAYWLWTAFNAVFPIFGGMASAIADVQNHWGELTSAVSVTLDAFVRFGNWINTTFKGVTDTIVQNAQKAGDAMNQLNPFLRHSPSLVENVQAGVAAIRKEYASVGGTAFPSAALSAAPVMAAGHGAGMTVQVVVQGNVLNWNETAEKLAEPVRAALLRNRRNVPSLGLT